MLTWMETCFRGVFIKRGFLYQINMLNEILFYHEKLQFILQYLRIVF